MRGKERSDGFVEGKCGKRKSCELLKDLRNLSWLHVAIRKADPGISAASPAKKTLVWRMEARTRCARSEACPLLSRCARWLPAALSRWTSTRATFQSALPSFPGLCRWGSWVG